MSAIADSEFLTARQVCTRYGGVSHMWIFRKTRDEGFPKPTHFGGGPKPRRFWRLADLVAWEKKQFKRAA